MKCTSTRFNRKRKEIKKNNSQCENVLNLNQCGRRNHLVCSYCKVFRFLSLIFSEYKLWWVKFTWKIKRIKGTFEISAKCQRSNFIKVKLLNFHFVVPLSMTTLVPLLFHLQRGLYCTINHEVSPSTINHVSLFK
jgi:ABC-type uncharacterized transport system permease subunit